jgi:hypothetical protein
VTIPDLHRLATKVRAIGFQGVDVKEQPEIGIQAGDYFFTVGELDSIENLGLFVNGMFAEIAAKRDKPARTQGCAMTQKEREFTHLRLLNLGGFLHAAEMAHGLRFPPVKGALEALVSRLADGSARVEFIEVRTFLDWAEAEIEPALRELPVYQTILLHALKDGGCNGSVN